MSDHGSAGNAGTPEVDDVLVRRKKELDENIAKVVAAGWTNRVPIDYETVMGGTPEADQTRDEVPWLANAAIYEWQDDFGEVGPENKQLEDELFGNSQERMRAGQQIKALSFNVTVEGPEQLKPIRNFEDAGLHPTMLENVMKLCGYTSPTPIQSYCIPALLTGHDVVGNAQTGSGKTAAYLMPILSRLMGKARMLAAPRPKKSQSTGFVGGRFRAEPLVLIVCPTRELACQIFDEARRLCYRTMLRPCVIYGGAPARGQREQLEQGCDVLVATPGRLMDFLQNTALLSLCRLKFTVIDEADELLSAGWEEVIQQLFQGADTNSDADHTYMMFSATFPKEARKLAKEFMEEDFIRIKVGRVGSTHANIKQQVVYVEEPTKNVALHDLIMSGPAQRTLIFVNSKIKCDLVDDYLYNKGLPVTSLHSDRTQREREDALRSFRTARCPIMVATGISARGIDVPNVRHVINYDLPSTQHEGITEYVHRIGRTARMGNDGLATSFFNDRNEDIADDIVKILLESKQAVPDFLQDHIPEDPDKIDWHDDTDDEDDAAGAGGFDAGGFDAGGFDAGGFDAGGFDTNGGGFDAGGSGDGGFDTNGGGAQADDENKMGNW